MSPEDLGVTYAHVTRLCVQTETCVAIHTDIGNCIALPSRPVFHFVCFVYRPCHAERHAPCASRCAVYFQPPYPAFSPASSLVQPPALPPNSYTPVLLRSAAPVQHGIVYLLCTTELPELHMHPPWLPGLWPPSLPSHAAYLMKAAKQQKRRGINLLSEPKKMPCLHSVNNNKTTRGRK